MVKESELFDNEFYYKTYPDVKIAVDAGHFLSGYDHYVKHGKRECRLAVFKPEIDYKIDQVNKDWSNHLTLKGWVEPEKIEIDLNMIEVPEKYQPIQNIEYPQGNKVPFERYFYEKFKELKPSTFRTYLPIYWTAYYVNNGYKTKPELGKYLKTLDKSKKYFTIVQYDDGILDDYDIDLLVYSMGCKKPGYYPIPLISQPINNNPQEHVEKDILMSFYGQNTHPIRKQMCDDLYEIIEFSKHNDIIGATIDYSYKFLNGYIDLSTVPIDEYYNILKRTVFALCPRGYGVTSFRMYEAMAFGCIPVYISDQFWEPFNLPFEYGLKIKPNQIKDLREMLKSLDIARMQEKVKYYYENYFVYSQCANSIIKTLTV